jgi:ABC-2 type transport system ATP-binding protein
MIKMLTGILVPDSGRLRVRGAVPHLARRENARKMGVVFGQRSQLWWELPVIDSFDVSRHVYDIPEAAYRRNVEFCADLLGLGDFLHTPVRQLSLGQRMRAEIAMALLHDPDVLFLDEPTIGLDVVAKDNIRRFLRAVNRKKGVTIILTSHDMRDIEEICPRILIVNEGRLVYDGAVSRLRELVGEMRQVTVEFAEDPGEVALPGGRLVRDDGRVKVFAFDRRAGRLFDLLGALSSRYPVTDVTMSEADIEDVIRTLYLQLAEQPDVVVS